jgi:hypothetical protein
MVTFIDQHPLTRNSAGKLLSRIATAFPRRGVIVTLPGTHALQRKAFVDGLNRQREQLGQNALTDQEQMAEWALSVDLIVEEDAILIRPDPDNMALAYEADAMLQAMPDPLPKRKIRFLHVLNEKVRQAVQRRGEAWRILPLPQSAEQMCKMILDSRIAIGGRPIYYYNATTGTRWLTFQEFSGLGKLDDEELRRHLSEAARYSALYNIHHRRELNFFGAGEGFSAADLAPFDFAALPPGQVRPAWEWLCRKFASAVPANLLADNVADAGWRNKMYCALIDQREDVVSEETLLGLSSEFFMQVQWLPGARLQEGELIFDPVFEERKPSSDELSSAPWENTARGLIGNLIQEYGNMEYLNIGRVIGSLGKQRVFQGRRDVFVVQVKEHESPQEVLQIIRMQKYDVRERLDQGKDLLRAMIESEEYTEYILDRRLACRQLGMNLSRWTSTRKLAERYSGRQKHLEGLIIRTTYFQREYIRGIASDKLHPGKLKNDEYALRLARLLGRAAATNLIVGRSDTDGKLIFDNGDEVVMEDGAFLPIEIFVADHTGTFGDYRGKLSDLAPHYAGAVNRRAQYLSDLSGFAQVYLDAFVERFEQIQAQYLGQKRAYDSLFNHRPRDPGGNLRFRWECILKRMAAANAQELAECIMKGITR